MYKKEKWAPRKWEKLVDIDLFLSQLFNHAVWSLQENGLFMYVNYIKKGKKGLLHHT